MALPDEQRRAAERQAEEREALDRKVAHAQANAGRVLVDVVCRHCRETVAQVYDSPDGPLFYAKLPLAPIEPETAKERLPSWYKWRKTFAVVAVLVELEPEATLDTRDCGHGSRPADHDALAAAIKWGHRQREPYILPLD